MVWQLLTWPAQSLLWLAEQIQDRVDAQLDDKENLQKELTALQIQLDLGDIDEDTYSEREETILLALQAIADAEAAEERAAMTETTDTSL
ncbi:MAG: hypothetical protein OHK0012_07030 [Synechococcales cyanobacterium]